MEMTRLSTGEMLSGSDIDANANRERTRQKRLTKWLGSTTWESCRRMHR